MNTYADTSVLFSLYATDANSAKADAWWQANPLPLPFSAFHRLELRNALSLAAFQKRQTLQEVQAAWQEVENDVAAGLLIPRSGLRHRFLRDAESIAQHHTPRSRKSHLGHPSRRNGQADGHAGVLYL